MAKRYSEEYNKAEAVKLVTERQIEVKAAAADLGVGKSTLDKWVRDASQRKASGVELTPNELEELKRLRKENRILRRSTPFKKSRRVLCQGFAERAGFAK